MAEQTTIRSNAFSIHYGIVVEEELEKIIKKIENDKVLSAEYNSRWMAIKFIEKDENVIEKLSRFDLSEEIMRVVESATQRLEKRYSDGIDTLFADKRYGWINGLVKEVVDTSEVSRISISDKIDQIVTNRVLGIPIFLALMWVVFKITTDVAGPFLDWVDSMISGPLTN